MPRKAKEKNDELNSIETTKKVAKTSTKSKVAKKTDSVAKSKTTTSKKATESKSTVKSNKSKSTTKSATKTTKSSSRAKSNVKTKSESVANVTPVIDTEYYDLPFRYNQTVVRILAQTPNTLFIYWDISDEDRKSYIQKYGEDFFEHTRPYLIITNETMHYSFEVEINDFANSWYLHINDSDCEYKIELGRKFIVDSNNMNDNQSNFEPYQLNDYLYITSSNELEMPNNHILFDKLGSSVFFRNIKTNIMEEKDISSISFLQKIGKVYNIYDLYKEIYQDELISDEFGLNLPSSKF